jgi:hypothetical protein
MKTTGLNLFILGAAEMISNELLAACQDMEDKVYDRYGILSFVFRESKEGVLSVTYNSCGSFHEGYSLIMEAYEDMEIGAIITDNKAKKVIYREDIEDLKVDSIFSYFMNLSKEE